MRWDFKIRCASRSDVGLRRENNEDALQIHLAPDEAKWKGGGNLFVVCDGMGGHAVGEVASSIASRTVPTEYLKWMEGDAPEVAEALRKSLELANQAINEQARENPDYLRMGTTCSALALGEFGGAIGHVGDSRVYRVRGASIEQLTFDHSLQWELARHGQVSVDSIAAGTPKNVITRCLGPETAVEVDVEGPFKVEPGDRFVLCSDGLTAHVSDGEIGQIVAHGDASHSARLLVNLANIRGGTDNSTVVVVDVEGCSSTPAAVVRRPRREAATVKFLLSLLIFASVAVAGGVLLSQDRTIPGSLMLTVGLLTLFSMAVRYFRSPRAFEQMTGQSGENVYQTDSTEFDTAFLNELVEHFDEVAANLEERVIDFDHTEANEAKSECVRFMEAGDPNSALSAIGKALDICMETVVDLRKRELEDASEAEGDDESDND